MKAIRIVVALLLLTAALPCRAAVISYTDKLDRIVDIPVPVERAVFLQFYEMLPALEIWDKVVGIADHAQRSDLLQRINSGVGDIASVGSGANVNIEAILTLHPDLVITWAWQAETIRFMTEKGLRVIALYPESIEDLYQIMNLFGTIFHREEQMAATRQEMERLFSVIKATSAKRPPELRKKMLYLGGRSNSVSCGVGINNNLLNLIGGINVAGGIKERNTLVSLEKLVVWNPEVIFIWGNAGYTAADIITNPQWRHIRAVRDGKVFKLPDWTTWSPRLALVALWMAVKAYPEDYLDADVDQLTDSLCQKTYGASCNFHEAPR